MSPVIVSGDVTRPVPNVVHVIPLFTDHSYDVMAAPPLLPAVKVSVSDETVAVCAVVVGALAAIASISNDLETSVATR